MTSPWSSASAFGAGEDGPHSQVDTANQLRDGQMAPKKTKHFGERTATRHTRNAGKTLLSIGLLSLLLAPAGLHGGSPVEAKELVLFGGGESYASLSIVTKVMGEGEGSKLLPGAYTDFYGTFIRLTGQKLATPGTGKKIECTKLTREDTDKLKLGREDAAIEVGEHGIMIRSHLPLGVSHALYWMLDYWGCRWYMANDIGEHVPRLGRVTLPLGVHYSRVAMDSRVESAHVQGKGYEQWLQRNRHKSDMWLSAQHYWLIAIPPKEYFGDHPEYYSLIGGKREPRQLCVSNPDVRRTMVEKALAYLEKNRRNMASFPIDPSDAYNHCQCKGCVALDGENRLDRQGNRIISNRVADFANHVAGAVAEKCPDKLVGYCAYLNKLTPPDQPLHDNVAIAFTHSGMCNLHLLPRDTCPSSKEYWELLPVWLQRCKHVYDYAYDPIPWNGGLPCPTYLERPVAIRRMHRAGVKGLIDDMGPRYDGANHLNRYFEARFAVNPDLDIDTELAEFCKNMYGPAADAMNRYYRELANALENEYGRRFGLDGYEDLFPPELIQATRKALDEAHAAAPADNQLIRKRLKMIELTQRHLEAYMTFVEGLKERSYQQSLTDKEAIFTAVKALRAENPLYAMVVPPSFDDATYRMTGATMKGLARTYADEMGFVRKWRVSPPYLNNDRAGNIKAPDAVVRNGKLALNGEEIELTPYTASSSFVDFREAYKGKINAEKDVHYAYAVTEVIAPEEMKAQLRSGGFYPYRIYFNNVKRYWRKGPNHDHPDLRVANVTLKKGKNTVVIMSAQEGLREGAGWGVWFRIVDEKGNALHLKAI